MTGGEVGPPVVSAGVGEPVGSGQGPATVGSVGSPADQDGVWAPRHRRLTLGMVLTVTLVAFEAMAISTVMPVVADDLGGLGLYGWVFSGFFLGSLLGIVVAGQLADTRGTRWPFAAALVLFVVGVVAGGAAQSMAQLVACRVVQGVGAGAVSAIAIASVGRSYPAELRPRVFAVFSTAWVVPGLIGPVAASSLAELLTWRSVFWGLLPFVALAAAMTVPILDRAVAADGPAADGDERPAPPAARRSVRAPATEGAASEGAATEGAAGDRAEAAASSALGSPHQCPASSTLGSSRPDPASSGRSSGRWVDAVVLVAGVGLVLGGSSARSPLVGAALVVAGVGPAAWALLLLVPPGTMRLRMGMPAAVAVRGLQTFAFFGTSAFVSLAITDARDESTWLAGVALTASTVSWTAGSWVQQRTVLTRGPRWLVQRGFALVALGVAGLLIGLQPVPVVLVIPLWALAGLGMGLSYSPLSVTVLAAAEPGREGSASASLQLTDVLGQSLGTGLAGVFVALGEARDWATGTSLDLAFAMTLAVALAGAAAASRLPRHLT